MDESNMSNRTMPDVAAPSPGQVKALNELLAAKAAGREMNTASQSLDRAVEVITHVITGCLQGISIGLCGEPTQADLQRAHELRSLLEDLP